MVYVPRGLELGVFVCTKHDTKLGSKGVGSWMGNHNIDRLAFKNCFMDNEKLDWKGFTDMVQAVSDHR